MNVIARQGLDFKVQGKRVTHTKQVPVNINHDIKVKLREGSLIDVSTIRIQNVVKVPTPVKEIKVKEDKKSNKEK